MILFQVFSNAASQQTPIKYEHLKHIYSQHARIRLNSLIHRAVQALKGKYALLGIRNLTVKGPLRYIDLNKSTGKQWKGKPKPWLCGLHSCSIV